MQTPQPVRPCASIIALQSVYMFFQSVMSVLRRAKLRHGRPPAFVRPRWKASAAGQHIRLTFENRTSARFAEARVGQVNRDHDTLEGRGIEALTSA